MTQEQETSSEGPPSALYEYTVQVYEELSNRAYVTNLGPEWGDEEGLVFEGYVTHLFKELNFSLPYFTKVMNELKRMECVVQLRRGGSTSMSKWLLIKPPTPENWRDAKVLRGKRNTDQKINDLNNRVNTMEEKVDLLMRKVFEDLGYGDDD